MDRMASVGCPIIVVGVAMLCGGCLTREGISRRFMLAPASQGDRIGSSLHLGSGQSRWPTRADVAVGSDSIFSDMRNERITTGSRC